MPIHSNKKGMRVQEFALLDTGKGLQALQNKLPPGIFSKLKVLADKGFAGETEFMEAVEARLKNGIGRYKRVILKFTNKDPKHFCYHCVNQIPHSSSCRNNRPKPATTAYPQMRCA